MYNIAIERLPEDPECQGVLRAQDGSWQLVVDKEGYPHLWVRVNVETIKTDDETTGLVPIEMFMKDGVGIRDIMKSTFGGEVPEDELDAAEKEWLETKDRMQIPEPKPKER